MSKKSESKKETKPFVKCPECNNPIFTRKGGKCRCTNCGIEYTLSS